jgi:hypothetical protein
MASLKAIGKLLKKQTPGQKKIETPLRNQRGYAKGQAKVAGTMAALGGMTIKELNDAKKEAKSEAERAKIQAAIEKTLREMAQEEAANKRSVGSINQSPRPKLRPEGNAKGGYKTKMATGGYANCGASVPGTQGKK